MNTQKRKSQNSGEEEEEEEPEKLENREVSAMAIREEGKGEEGLKGLGGNL